VPVFGLVAPGLNFNSVNTLPINCFLNQPSDSYAIHQTNVFSTFLEYRISDDWALRNLLGYQGFRFIRRESIASFLQEDGRTLERSNFLQDIPQERYTAEVNLTGRCTTGGSLGRLPGPCRSDARSGEQWPDCTGKPRQQWAAHGVCF
jgi:hypothetical protein